MKEVFVLINVKLKKLLRKVLSKEILIAGSLS